MSTNSTTKLKNQENGNHGTQEWSVKTVNCCSGVFHDCIYCLCERHGSQVQTSHTRPMAA